MKKVNHSSSFLYVSTNQFEFEGTGVEEKFNDRAVLRLLLCSRLPIVRWKDFSCFLSFSESIYRILTKVGSLHFKSHIFPLLTQTNKYSFEIISQSIYNFFKLCSRISIHDWYKLLYVYIEIRVIHDKKNKSVIEKRIVNNLRFSNFLLIHEHFSRLER